MEAKDYWQEFVNCGSVSSYLEYTKQKCKETENNNDDKSVYDKCTYNS